MGNKNEQITDYKYLKNIYRESIKSRSDRITYSSPWPPDENKKYANRIKRAGSCTLKDAVSKSKIAAIHKKSEEYFTTGNMISAGRDLSALATGLVSSDQLYKDYNDWPRINNSIISKGVSAFRNSTDNVKILNPFIAIPETLELALNDKIIDIAHKYFGAPPSISYVKLVKNFANSLPCFNTQKYHIDLSSIKLLKAIFYLNDVGSGDGPHCYVLGSHKEKEKIKNWSDSATLYGGQSEESLLQNYTPDRFLKLFGDTGDVILEDTTGLHKGEKPVNKDRDVLIITYSMHEEYTFGYKVDRKEKITREQYRDVPDDQKYLLDLLEIR